MAHESESRYARDWNMYSASWDGQYAGKYRHLGDEWNDDGTDDRKRDSYYFQIYADRFLHPDMTALEVGPGGGKWTVQLAPRVKKLLVLDVSQEMLTRTKSRLDGLGIRNAEYVLCDGSTFGSIADESVDFFFSYDVFVHIALEDTFRYTQEIARVLKPHSLGVCHYAINSVPHAWTRIEQHNEHFRKHPHTLGQYYYFTPESLIRMYEHLGLCVREHHVEWLTCVLVFHKLPFVSAFEECLQILMSEAADDSAYRSSVAGRLKDLIVAGGQRLLEMLAQTAKEEDVQRRKALVAEIRRGVRGL